MKGFQAQTRGIFETVVFQPFNRHDEYQWGFKDHHAVGARRSVGPSSPRSGDAGWKYSREESDTVGKLFELNTAATKGGENAHWNSRTSYSHPRVYPEKIET